MILRIGGAGGLLLLLAACGGHSSGVPTTTTAPVTTSTPASFQSRFGTAFAADFNASNTTEPVKPAAGDVPALNFTAEPLDN